MAENIFKSQIKSQVMRSAPVNQEHAGSNISSEGWREGTKNGTDVTLGSMYKSIVEGMPELMEVIESNEEMGVFATSLVKSFDVLGEYLNEMLNEQYEAQGEFNKSLYSTLEVISEQMGAVEEETSQLAGDEEVTKSLGENVVVHNAPGEGGAHEIDIDREVILDSLEEMVKSGSASHIDLCRFEDEGRLPQHLQVKLGLARA